MWPSQRSIASGKSMSCGCLSCRVLKLSQCVLQSERRFRWSEACKRCNQHCDTVPFERDIHASVLDVHAWIEEHHLALRAAPPNGRGTGVWRFRWRRDNSAVFCYFSLKSWEAATLQICSCQQCCGTSERPTLGWLEALNSCMFHNTASCQVQSSPAADVISRIETFFGAHYVVRQLARGSTCGNEGRFIEETSSEQHPDVAVQG